jgi:conjugal transfer pilus assembly protein TraK
MTPSKRAALFGFTLAASASAHALQTITVRDGETVLAKIAQKEVTRIAFEEGRIRKVTGNAGEFTLEKDEDKGQIFIRPTDPAATKPINLFISSEHSTVGLLLQPVDAPSDTIIIRERRDPSSQATPTPAASRHVRTLKNLVLAMATDALPEHMEVREAGLELALWPGLRMTLQRVYLGATIVGEKYLLANTSASEARFAARELYKPGVMAVSIESDGIPAGEVVNVFVIRERRPHE